MRALRVLVVDDESELVNAVVERLNLRGMDAHGVTSGAQALAELESKEFDVVLLDVKMPGLGGLEVIRQIKLSLPRLQVILLTGHGSARYAEEGMKLGAFDYLMKPIDIEDLVAILNAAAGREQDGKP